KTEELYHSARRLAPAAVHLRVDHGKIRDVLHAVLADVEHGVAPFAEPRRHQPGAHAGGQGTSNIYRAAARRRSRATGGVAKHVAARREHPAGIFSPLGVLRNGDPPDVLISPRLDSIGSGLL